MSFSLPPAASPLEVTITFNVNIAPYVEKWYNENKLVAETPSDFLTRVIGPSVIDYAASRELAAFKAQFDAVQATNRAEVLSVKQTNGF
jgi:hypothetical protein